MKFGGPTQNGMKMMMKWPESVPEVELKYGDRLFLKTGYSYISVVD